MGIAPSVYGDMMVVGAHDADGQPLAVLLDYSLSESLRSTVWKQDFLIFLILIFLCLTRVLHVSVVTLDFFYL